MVTKGGLDSHHSDTIFPMHAAIVLKYHTVNLDNKLAKLG